MSDWDYMEIYGRWEVRTFGEDCDCTDPSPDECENASPRHACDCPCHEGPGADSTLGPED